jgi:hypothetical protein
VPEGCEPLKNKKNKTKTLLKKMEIYLTGKLETAKKHKKE